MLPFSFPGGSPRIGDKGGEGARIGGRGEGAWHHRPVIHWGSWEVSDRISFEKCDHGAVLDDGAGWVR